MTEGENKRTVKKKNNTNRMNIKVSTQDKTLTKDNDINLKIDGEKGKNAKKNASANNKTLNEETKEEKIDVRISKLIEKNKQSQKEIETIQSKIDIQSKEEIDKIVSLNKELSELDKNHFTISKDNKTLITKLKTMEEEVSKRFADKFKISKVIERKKKEGVKRDLNAEIKAKEIQKKTEKKIIKYNKKEIKKLNEILDKEGKGQELNEELKQINEKINKTKTEIEELNKVKMDHNLCQKNKNLLKTKLNVLLNDFEFESKKSNMMEVEKKEPTVIKNVNMTMMYGESVRKKLLNNTENKYNSKIKIVNYRSFNYLLKDMENMKDNKKLKDNPNLPSKSLNDLNQAAASTYMDSSAYYSLLKNDISCKIDTKSPKKYLFTEQENNILKKMLPTEYYNKYNEKYNSKENQLTEIEDKFKEHEQMKSDINLNNIKYDAINIKIKELSLIKSKLYVDYSKNIKKIAELKRSIKLYQDEVKKQNLILNAKNKNNEHILKKIEELKKEKKLQTD